MAIESLTVEAAQALASGYTAIGAGLAVGLTGIGTGLGEMSIGAAAVGATAEDRGMFGLALVFTVLPETIVIFGLVVALLLLFV
ncbi:MAG: ATPase [Methanocorpusculum sp.]|jgi:V/A-type H+-transporting ATPase subunit K|nr:ATPase [Methanocorpusculum sp.]MDD2470429.1 ATPase [Methanocorpusculum sp.]MDD4132509.1 ATPase [Methanocorpusculum sp.]